MRRSAASFVTPPVADPPAGRAALLGGALRRPGARRATSLLAVALFLAGVGLFAYPFFTDLYTKRLQHHLGGEFADPGFQQAYRQRRVRVGEGLTRLRIPKLGVDVLVVEGTTPDALRAGAGHYQGTPLPGEVGNVGIAGHRTTYGRPFNRLDELRPGDDVLLETPFAEYTYQAMPGFDGHPNPFVVRPTDYGVLDPVATSHWLTLTTCHPKGSAALRLVLRLELVATTALRSPPPVPSGSRPGGGSGGSLAPGSG